MAEFTVIPEGYVTLKPDFSFFYFTFCFIDKIEYFGINEERQKSRHTRAMDKNPIPRINEQISWGHILHLCSIGLINMNKRLASLTQALKLISKYLFQQE